MSATSSTNWQTRRLLVTVKATPHTSTKYGETVCVAGIDVDSREWVRLYPVQFRDLAEENRFAKYSIIEAQTKKVTEDHRHESLRVNTDSIKVVESLGTDDSW